MGLFYSLHQIFIDGTLFGNSSTGRLPYTCNTYKACVFVYTLWARLNPYFVLGHNVLLWVYFTRYIEFSLTVQFLETAQQPGPFALVGLIHVFLTPPM